MSLTFVQRVAGSGTSSITFTIAATQNHSLLVVCLEQSNSGNFTPPAGGWVKGPSVAFSTLMRVEQWYLINNPGGITSLTFTGHTGTFGRGSVTEWSGPTGATQELVAKVSGTVTGPVSGITLTPPAGSAGGAAMYNAAGIYSVTEAGTYTQPSGWTGFGAGGGVLNADDARLSPVTGSFVQNPGAVGMDPSIGCPTSTAGYAYAASVLGPLNCGKFWYNSGLPASVTDSSGVQGNGQGGVSITNLPSNCTPILVFTKSNDANLASFVNSINFPCYLVFGNEAEATGKFASYTAFINQFEQASNTIKAQQNPNVKVAQVSLGYAYHNTVNADAKAGRWVVPAQYVDVYLLDAYQHYDNGGTGYAWPSAGLSNWDQWLNWIAVFAGNSRPVGIAEYGIDSQGLAADPTGAYRSTRLAADITYLTSAFTPGGGSAVSPYPMELWCYWYANCQSGVQSTNPRTMNQFPSTETATVNSWKSLVSGLAPATIDYATTTNNQGWAGAIGIYNSVGLVSAPTITTNTPLPNAALSQSYSSTPAMTASGASPFTWSLGSGAPPGLSLSSGGVWGGTPTAVGIYTFNITVTDTNSLQATSSFTITVYPTPSVLTTALPDATAGQPYTTGLQAAGMPPFTWAVTSGTLPSGMSIDNVNQAITGTDTTVESQSFTLRVTDATGRTASQALVLTVDPSLAPPAITDSLIVAGRFELLAGQEVSDDPACAGATFMLGKQGGDVEYDLGMPQPVVDVLAALGLDGERPMGRRASNRTMVLPIVIVAPDRDTLAAAREALLSAIDADSFDLEWSRADAEPLIFDCFRAAATTYYYSLPKDQMLVSTMDITFTALPYGRSTDLETMAFPPASASWPSPLSAIQIDDFSASVSSTVDPDQWMQSTLGVGTDAFSARWSRKNGACPTYNYSLSAPVNIGIRTRVSFWVGLTTTTDQYHVWHGGNVQFDISLTDGSGYTAQMAVTARCHCSGKPGVPEWTKVSSAVPANTFLDVTTISSYTIKAWNTTDPRSRNRVLQADAYFSNFTSSPIVVGSAGVRGAAYDLRGVIGSARAPLNIQVQPGIGTAQTVATFTSAGGQPLFTVPGGTTLAWLEATGAGGGGGAGSAGTVADGGAGGGGGEWSAEPAWQVVPGQGITCFNGTGGSGAPSPSGTNGTAGSDGTDSTISIGGVVVVRAHAGKGGPRGILTNDTGGAGGTGSQNTLHHDGGDGGRPQGGWGQRYEGSGGGSSGGQFDSGNDGQTAVRSKPGSPTFLAGPGGAAVDGGGPGGNGGNNHAGHTPGSGPGGGGGGGDGSGSGFGGGNGFTGQTRIIYGTPTVFPIKSLVLHRPGHSAPPAYQPLVAVGGGIDTPDGSIDYPILSPVANVPAKFGGRTYTVLVVAKAWHSSNNARLITIAITQNDGVTQNTGNPSFGGRQTTVSVSRNVTPATDAPNGVVVIDDVALPPRMIAGDQAGVDYTVNVTSGDTADRFYDVLILDCEGSTVLLDSTGDGFTNIWLDSPEPGLGVGLLLGSPGDRDSASSIMDEARISGPPMYVEPGDQWLLAYSPTGAPALFASYLPRWYLDRLR